MKIAIMGYSGSGKSTLAEKLGQRFGLPVLHLDSVQFEAGWKVRDPAQSIETVRAFLAEHPDGWVIDGNYKKFELERRLEEAARIFLLLLPRLTCLARCRKRYRMWKGKTRPDVAPGCEEKMDAEFVRWILFDGRTRAQRARFREILRRYPEKATAVRSQKGIDRLFASI